METVKGEEQGPAVVIVDGLELPKAKPKQATPSDPTVEEEESETEEAPRTPHPQSRGGGQRLVIKRKPGGRSTPVEESETSKELLHQLEVSNRLQEATSRQVLEVTRRLDETVRREEANTAKVQQLFEQMSGEGRKVQPVADFSRSPSAQPVPTVRVDTASRPFGALTEVFADAREWQDPAARSHYLMAVAWWNEHDDAKARDEIKSGGQAESQASQARDASLRGNSTASIQPVYLPPPQSPNDVSQAIFDRVIRQSEQLEMRSWNFSCKTNSRYNTSNG